MFGKIAARPENIEFVNHVIRESWDKSTCWIDCWDETKPETGHCRVTAVLIQALFGGDIIFSSFDDGTTHYRNLLPDGTRCDLTEKQFPEGTAIPEGEIIPTSRAILNSWMAITYPILFRRVMEQLSDYFDFE